MSESRQMPERTLANFSLLGTAVIFLSIAAAAGWRSQTIPESIGSLVAEPPVLDFGTVPSGRSVLGELVLRNNSDEPIRVLGIDASCSCAVTELESNIIASGDYTRMVVTMATEGAAVRKEAQIAIRYRRASGNDLERLRIHAVAHVVNP